MENRIFPVKMPSGLGFSLRAWPLLLLAGLLTLTVFYNFLLFHTLAELFAIMVAILVAVVGWQTYPFSRNDFLMFLAVGYFWIGVLDLLHTLSYKGIGIVEGDSANLATQFWVATRYLEAFVLLAAPAFAVRRLYRGVAFSVFGVVAVVVSVLIFAGNFPDAFVAGRGLTPFKVLSEYIIIGLLVLALWHLWARRYQIDRRVVGLMAGAIIVTVFSEFMFTLYQSVYGLENLLGHIGKLISYWLVFISIVETSLNQPFRLLARGATTYDAVPDAIVVVDHDAVIRQTNRVAREQIGEPDPSGRPVHPLLHPPQWAEKECPICHHIREEITQPVTFEVPFEDTGDWQRVTISPFGTQGTAQAGVVHVSYDITERKRTEKALQTRNLELSSILQSVGDGIFGVDREGRAIFNNPALERLTGWDTEAFIGRDTHSALHQGQGPEDHSRDSCRVLQTLRDGDIRHSDDDIFHRRDGTAFPVSFTSAPLRGEDGSLSGAVVVFRDITERKLSEQALAASEQRYRALMENASDAIAVVGSDKHFVDANRRAEALFGRTLEELRELAPQDIHPDGDEQVLERAFRDMEEYGHSLYEHHVLRPDGTLIPVEVAGTRVRYGGETLFMGTFRDLTERKRIEGERERYRQQLESTVAERTRELQEVNREMETFSYSVSHDLRAPLRAVNGFGQALIEDFGEKLDEEARGYIERMRSASTRMGQMIDGLLDLSRLTRREMNRQTVDVSTLAAELADLVAGGDPQRQVEWRIHPGMRVSADPTLLRLLLQNLLENAWKFTADCDRAVIEVGSTECGGEALFFVRDNGIGFEPETAKSLYQPFQRLHRGEKYQGSGIGLATVQRIVHRHSGRTWAEGKPGEGATVYFTLPDWDESAEYSSNIY